MGRERGEGGTHGDKKGYNDKDTVERGRYQVREKGKRHKCVEQVGGTGGLDRWAAQMWAGDTELEKLFRE